MEETRTCKNGHAMTGFGSDTCPECEAPFMSKKDKEEAVIYASGCRCSLMGLQNEANICHHKEKACHRISDESERCPQEKKESWEEEFDKNFDKGTMSNQQ